MRADGRQCEDYRSLEVETGVLPQSDGSAAVRVVSLKSRSILSKDYRYS